VLIINFIKKEIGKMKKRLLGLMLVGVMSAAMLVGCGSSASEEAQTTQTEATADDSAADTAVDTSVFDDLKDQYGADVFDPDTNYDEYAIIEYTIEDAGATFAVTVSKKSDNSEYQIHCMFYGDEQVAVYNGSEVTEDKTGFMGKDTPLICQAAEDNGVWLPIQ